MTYSKYFILRSAALFSCIAMLLTGCNSDKYSVNKSESKEINTSGMSDIVYRNKDGGLNYEGYEEIAGNANVSLSINKADGSLIILNRKNDFMWSSSYDLKKNLIEKKLNEKWRFNLNSSVLISYFDKDNNTGVDSETNAFAEKAKIATDSIKNGAEITYAFEGLEIAFKLEINLTEDGFEVGIKADSIKETGKYRLTKISLLPFFGGAPSTNEGYLFYPDGSGALAYFNPKNTLKPAETLTLETYGTENLNVSELLNDRILKRKQAMLPVFGLKNGDNAFLGVITQGDADSSINISSSNLIVDLNNIYPSFCYRRRIDITSVNNSINTTKDAKTYQFDSEMSGGDVKVRYYLLNGNSADYSGMAATYREYLESEGKLNKVDCEQQILSLNIFMGAVEDRAIFSKYQTVTTYNQAYDIVSEIKSTKDIGAINVTLNGWNKGGYRNSVMPAVFNGKYGGKSEFKKIPKQLSSENTKFYLKQDYTYFNSENSRFSKGKDIAYQATGLPAADNSIYLPNLTGLVTRYLNRFTNFADDYGYSISLLGVGSQLYCDYNTRTPLTRRESLDYITETLEETKKSDISLITEGNAYMLKYIDGITNVPSKDSGYPMTSTAIPFYQMIVHGSIPYSSGESGTLSANLETLKLKWIEYGFSPEFEVTSSSSSDLKYTDYNKLFSSRFKSWKERIFEITGEINRLGVSAAKMLKHRQLQNKVFKVVYDNGTEIIVNYNGTAVNIDGTQIGAEDYLVIKRGE